MKDLMNILALDFMMVCDDAARLIRATDGGEKLDLMFSDKWANDGNLNLDELEYQKTRQVDD